MNTKVVMETVDVSQNENRSLELCKGEIPGARPVHHTIKANDRMVFAGNVGFYHILILISGDAVFVTDGKEYAHKTRVTFVPDAASDLTVIANTDVQILEIQWDIFPEDTDMLAEYKTVFPVNVPYQESIQYIDPNKSKKTISRMMIPQRVIPRFSIGSVESVDRDTVKSHSHPMLDQFFFSFPENEMDVMINGEPIHMMGNIIMHIPLGADHGVEVYDGKHMHYMWIDFMPDNQLALARLDASHHPTGENRSF